MLNSVGQNSIKQIITTEISSSARLDVLPAQTSDKPISTKSTPCAVALIEYKKTPEQILEDLKPVIYKLVANFETKKTEILKKDDSKISDDDLISFYQQFSASLGNNSLRDRLQVIIETYHGGKCLNLLTGQEIIEAMNRSGSELVGESASGNQLYSRQNNFFFEGKLDTDLKARLEQHSKNIFGKPSQWDELPIGALSTTQLAIIDALKDTVKELKDRRFSFIGNGSTGLTIKISEQDSAFVLKVLIPEKNTEFGQDFVRELDAMHEYEKQDRYPLVEIPSLVYDKNGKEIAESGVFILKKLQTGESLFQLQDPLETEPGKQKSNIDFYTNLGISDEFAIQYFQFFTDFAKKGIDLDDIRFYNYFYKPETQSLSLFEIGINSANEKALKRKESAQEKPLVAALHSLMSDILLFEGGARQPKDLHRKLTGRAAQDWGIKNFHNHRAAQLIRVLQKLVKDERSGYSLDEMKNAANSLNSQDEFHRLSLQGKQYLQYLIKHLNDPKFLDYTFG